MIRIVAVITKLGNIQGETEVITIEVQGEVAELVASDYNAAVKVIEKE